MKYKNEPQLRVRIPLIISPLVNISDEVWTQAYDQARVTISELEDSDREPLLDDVLCALQLIEDSEHQERIDNQYGAI